MLRRRSGSRFLRPSARCPRSKGRCRSELVETALKPLWGCWRALFAARNKREPLELDLPERQVVLDEKGRIESVAPRERLDAHRLVEDFMIAANVAAARALEAKKSPVMYRVHEPPSREKLEALKDYLETFGIEFTLGQVIKPATFNRIIERVGESDSGRRSWSSCFGRRCRRAMRPIGSAISGSRSATYAHFTSPIRRYADLLVHRALVSAYKLGEGGLPPADAEQFERDRRADLEARAARDGGGARDRRPLCRGLSRRSGRPGRRCAGSPAFSRSASSRRGRGFGGDGLVPVSTIGDEYFRYDEKAQQLVGEDSGTTYRLGQKLKLRIAEANPVSGSLRFELPEASTARTARAARAPRPGAHHGGAAGRRTSATAVATQR